jgi:hypothetical protein
MNKNSKNLDYCDYCHYCDSCDSCYYCDYCDSCYYCDYCDSCDSCDYCYYSKDLRMSEYMIFCYSLDKKEFYAFNKDVGEDRYYGIKGKVRSILDDLTLELNKNYWSEGWKKVTKEQWKELSEIPEFDKEVVENIVGFEINLENTVKVRLKGGEVVEGEIIKE